MRHWTKRQYASALQRREKFKKAQEGMHYRGLINLDFTGQNNAEYQKLISALTQLGWKYLETSALTIEGKHDDVLQALEVLAKQCGAAGTLSALTLHIQGSKDFGGKPYGAMYPHALAEIRAKSLPGA